MRCGNIVALGDSADADAFLPFRQLVSYPAARGSTFTAGIISRVAQGAPIRSADVCHKGNLHRTRLRSTGTSASTPGRSSRKARPVKCPVMGRYVKHYGACPH